MATARAGDSYIAKHVLDQKALDATQKLAISAPVKADALLKAT